MSKKTKSDSIADEVKPWIALGRQRGMDVHEVETFDLTAPIPSTMFPVTVPTAQGDLAITAAAYWMMTKGGTTEVSDLREPGAWRAAFKSLFDWIAAEAVKAQGIRRSEGFSTRIDHSIFSNLPVVLPFMADADQVLAGMFGTFGQDQRRGYLWSVPPTEGEFQDRIFFGRELVFSGVTVSCADLHAACRFDAPEARNDGHSPYVPLPEEFLEWFLKYIHGLPNGAADASEDNDFEAAKDKWPSIKREYVREQRKHVLTVERGRNPVLKSEFNKPRNT